MPQQPAGVDPDADADPSDGRRETVNQRMDRNWAELLQELRVTQTGTQILTGFLLTVAFQPRFAQLSATQRGLYLALVLAAVVTTALALTPVNLHRGLFRRRSKVLIVRIGHRMLQITLAGVALVLVGSVLLIVDVTLGLRPALVIGGLLALLLLGLGALPFVLRRRAGPAGPD